MQFLYPSFLFALGFIAIPILIHLFNFRRYKRIVFSDIRFLKQYTEQTKKQKKLKEWLILLCRVLLILFLVLAFAQPYLPSSENKTPLSQTAVGVYLDNSFSMNAMNKNGVLLDQAKVQAEALVNAFPEQQTFLFLSNDFEGKYMRELNKSEIINAIHSTSLSASHRSLQAILNRQTALVNQLAKESGNLYWISDFQKNMEPLPENKSAKLAIHLIPLSAAQNQNVWIDTAYFTSPLLKIGNQNKVQVFIKNESELDFENQAIVLKIDGVQKAIQNLSCKSGERIGAQFLFSLPDNKWHQISISLTDYPIIFDDEYFLAAKAQESIPVMAINDGFTSSSFKKVFDLDSFYTFTEVSIQQIDFSKLFEQALLILNEPKGISSGLSDELYRYLEKGGVVLFIPSPTPDDLASIKQFLLRVGLGLGNNEPVKISVGEIETKDPLFAQVFSTIPSFSNLPQVSAYWQLNPTTTRYRKIIAYANQDPFLLRTNTQQGSFYAFSASLQPAYNSLIKHPLFVPIMLNLPIQRKKPIQSSFLLGEKSVFQLPINQNENLLSIRKGKESHLVSVQIKDQMAFGNLSGQIKESGVYDVQSGELSIAKLAFNYPRLESKQGFIDPKVLSEVLPASIVQSDLAIFKENIRQSHQGSQYWKLALALALFFLLAEFALIAWFK